MTDTPTALPDGEYPFMDQVLPLSDMAWIEMPSDLEEVVLTTAAANGIDIVRGRPVELTCKTPMGDAAFTVYWPAEGDRLNMLAPRHFQRGRA